jgi:hypothetical protein
MSEMEKMIKIKERKVSIILSLGKELPGIDRFCNIIVTAPSVKAVQTPATWKDFGKLNAGKI